MSDSDYLTRLARELSDAGIWGDRRARILTEFQEHLSSDPGAELGEPPEIAAQFADELGSDLARQAALRAFAALALAGVLFGIAFITGGRVHSFAAHGSAVGGLGSAVGQSNPSALAMIAMAVCLVAVQVSVAAGVLGLLRAIRLREHVVVATEEATVLVRRAGVALLAGAVALLALPLVAVTLPQLSSSWKVLAYVVTGVGLVSVASAVPAVRAGLRLRPRVEGCAGDLVDDLDAVLPLSPRLLGSPWQFAMIVSVTIAVVLTAAGIAQSDPFDGALRGLADGFACLLGFAFLGRYLGLRTGPSGVRVE